MKEAVDLKLYTVDQVRAWLVHNEDIAGLTERLIDKTRANALVTNPYVRDDMAIISAIFVNGTVAAYTYVFPDLMERPNNRLIFWNTTLYVNPKYEGRGYAYCVTPNRTGPSEGTTLNFVSSTKGGGVAYLLNRAGTSDTDYLITQLAIWKFHNNFMHDEYKRNQGKDVVKKALALANEANNNKNWSSAPTLKLDLASINLTESSDRQSYKSSAIKASVAQNISSYKVTLTGAPSGTVITKNNTNTNYTGEFTVNSNESFIIKVPKNSVTVEQLSITIKASAVGNTQYMAYEYQPVDTNMQNVALLEKVAQSATSALALQITKAKKPVISITKVDQDTRKPLAGATLVIKDAKGEIVYKFDTTENAEVITSIEDYGKYTVEELSAPAGYIKSDKVIEITIDKDHLSHQITFENTKETYVPNTATNSSIIMVILGIVLIGTGLRFVYKNAKA